MKKVLLLHMVCLALLCAQIKIVKSEKLPIPKTEQWSNARFSPSGEEIFLTNSEYNGIWQYSFVTKLLKVITLDNHSGYNFVISDDGLKIAYRRTLVQGDQYSRVQETVELELSTLNQTVLEKGNSLPPPVFVYDRNSRSQKILSGKTTFSAGQSAPLIVGIVDTKIVLMNNGLNTIVDPFPKGQYIWPVISPDKTKLVAVEMDRGAFISDLDGKNIIRLGKCNAPQWTRDGKWIIGMDDKDDGHTVYASEIIAVSSDGTKHYRLTETPSQHEMFPAVSPSKNKIVATTLEGEVIVLTFEEGQ